MSGGDVNFDRLFTMYEAMTTERNKMRKALLLIAEGYGPNHGSKYCRDVATAALPNADTPAERGDIP